MPDAQDKPPVVCPTCGVDRQANPGVCDCEAQETRRKFCYLTAVDLMRLSDACIRIREAFGYSPSLVGSVTEGPEWRDVDVRSILTDEDFDRYFPKGSEFFWSLFCMAVSEYLRAATGLPVDYQVQRMSVANEKFPEGKRTALGTSARLYAGGGDAT